MRNARLVRLVLGAALCHLTLGLPTVRAEEKMPVLAVVPDNLPGADQAAFGKKKQALLKQLADFQAAARTFNAKKAEKQSDAEFNSLQVRRTEFVSAAKAFNREVAAAQTAVVERAALPAAKIFSTGEFHFVTKDGRKVNGKDGIMLPLDGGTRILTGPGSRVKMLLPDETIFTIGPNSDMVVDDFVYDAATSTTKAVAEFAKGSFRWVTGKISKAKDIKIKMGIIAIGIRGTDFEAMLGPGGAGHIELYEGQLEITPKATGKTFMLKAGKMISFTADGVFSKPAPLKP